MTRLKRYYIKEISKDGLIKNPENFYGDEMFYDWGYATKEDAWLEIEKFATNSANTYRTEFSFIIITEWTVKVGE